MERLAYFLRRVLLMVPTFLGITFVCFALCQVVPGGPVEQALAKMRGLGAAEAGRSAHAGAAISPEQRQALEAHFGFDRPLPQRPLRNRKSRFRSVTSHRSPGHKRTWARTTKTPPTWPSTN